MRFHAEHRFGGSVDAVAALLVDPDFHRQLALPDLARPDVVQHDTAGDEVVLRLRYQYVGQLDPIARRILSGRQLTWLQELRLDRSQGTGRLTFEAEASPRQLRGRADFDLVAVESGGPEPITERRIKGELVVKVPMVGGQAERRIVPGLLRRLDVEAEALDQRLRAQTDSGAG